MFDFKRFTGAQHQTKPYTVATFWMFLTAEEAEFSGELHADARFLLRQNGIWNFLPSSFCQGRPDADPTLSIPLFLNELVCHPGLLFNKNLPGGYEIKMYTSHLFDN